MAVVWPSVREHGPVISHIADSDVAERTWCTVHTDVGPVLLGAAYRAGDVPIGDSEDLSGPLLSLDL